MCLKNRLKLLLLLGTICISANAQLPDGVIGTDSYILEIRNNYANENNMVFDMNHVDLSAKLTIRAHVIFNRNGDSGISKNNIVNSLILTNSYFKNIGLQFILDSVDYISDYNYSYITYNNNKAELLSKHAIKNVINLFLADSIKMGRFQSYGYTYFPIVTDSNYIFISKQYFTANSLITMLGHFFGLISTHDTTSGSELVNEINCSNSGDLICDTYADPDIFNLVSSTCNYSGYQIDRSGKFYVPSVANFMSNSNDACKCIFTSLQYRRMYYYYKKYRQYLN